MALSDAEALATMHEAGHGLWMLLWREKIPETWLPQIRANLGPVLVDHAHLERKAATSALNLEKYVELYDCVSELNAIAIEELQHFEIVLLLLRERGIPFAGPQRSPWIAGMMAAVRKGRKFQVIDHLIVCALIEGRSCEKFQILAEGVRDIDAPLAAFYASLVESEGNHYAAYLIGSRRGVDSGAESFADVALARGRRQAPGMM
jgi:tRNA-(ms[2]io[6]A)-hydroxylase